MQYFGKNPQEADGGVVGLHQDWTYWAHPSIGPTGNPDGGGWGGSGLCTCWVALGDVGPESGPLLFVRGSHRWGVEISDLTLSRQDNHLVRDQVEVSPMAVSSERRFSAASERLHTGAAGQ